VLLRNSEKTPLNHFGLNSEPTKKNPNNASQTACNLIDQIRGSGGREVGFCVLKLEFGQNRHIPFWSVVQNGVKETLCTS